VPPKKKHLQKKYNTLLAIYKINQSLTSTLKTNKILSEIIDTLIKEMDADAVSIRLLSKDKKRLILRAAKGIRKEHWHKHFIKSDNGIAGEVLAQGIPLTSNNIFKDKRYVYFPWLKKEKLHSLLCAPLVFKEKKIGVISIYNKKSFFYKKEDGEILLMFATQATIALENARLFEELQKSYLSAIKTLAAIIDLKDEYTRGHSEKVSYYADLIARKLRLPPIKREMIRYAAFLHDIGKIGVEIAILHKPGSLTPEEWKIIHQHPVNGSAIVRELGFLKELVPIILYHHERYDGKGYPEKKKNEEIPLGARILAVADSFDAMISKRAYRDALSKKKAVEELKCNRGTQFDPAIVDAFLAALAQSKNKLPVPEEGC